MLLTCQRYCITIFQNVSVPYVFFLQMGPYQPRENGSSGREGGLSSLRQLFQQKVQPSQPPEARQRLSQVKMVSNQRRLFYQALLAQGIL
jgi:hypothetical protein